MSWLESQIETRARLDNELLTDSYAELASSVTDPRHAPSVHMSDLDQVDGAVRTCLRYIDVQPANIPDSVTDIGERIDYMCHPAGVLYRTVRLEPEWYKDAFGALLGTLKTGERVALLPAGIHGYVYIHPGTGARIKVTAENASLLEEEALFFYRSFPQKPLHIADMVRFLLNIFDTGDYIAVIVATLVSTLVGLLPAIANKIAFSVVVPSGQVGLIAPIAALLVGTMLATTLIQTARSLVMNRVNTKLNTYTEAATFARVLSLPASFFRNYSSGELANRISSVNLLAQTITSISLGAGLTSLFSGLYVFQIAAYAPALVVPAIIVVVLQALVTSVAAVITVNYEHEAMEANARLSGTVTALLNGVTKIKLAGAEDRAFAKWAHDYSEYARYTYNRPVLLRILPALITLISMLGTVAIYYFAGASHVTPADYMAFNMSYGQMTGAVMTLANMATQMVQIRPLLQLVSPILEAVPESTDDKPSVAKLTGGIEMNNVSFRYDDHSPYVIRDLSLKIRPGEYVALVGKSGCGKSTIMRLLLGFEKPERGTIFYGGYDISKVNLQSLRQAIGTVMQDGKLFMGDIFSNITIAAPLATLDDAWEAAEIAGIADDIRRMPMGMQTFLSEGSGGVSGGQKQRLMIARAVCGQRRILMLDEATSALDNVTQRHVVDALATLNCTRLVVAHRLSTVRHCDRILVVDQGRIVEEGNYEELIAKGGVFAELVERQRLEGEA